MRAGRRDRPKDNAESGKLAGTEKNEDQLELKLIGVSGLYQMSIGRLTEGELTEKTGFEVASLHLLAQGILPWGEILNRIEAETRIDGLAKVIVNGDGEKRKP